MSNIYNNLPRTLLGRFIVLTLVNQYVNLKLMNDYELTCLISSALEEKERNKAIEEIKALITDSEGEIINLSPSKEVDLGYPIKDEVKAYMLIVDLKIVGEKIEEIKKSLNEKKGLLRFFLIKREAQKIKAMPKRKIEKIGETDREGKIKLIDIDQKIEELLNPSGKASEEDAKELEENKQNNESE
ncbi:30S ribosomal protein S6 [Patescibacteria group bacterium]|nr:30S ribosomal protein S6 [Patescibacteria group bacterium]MBU4022978.1 30S ribosomal protein S6 [Patescibacteria group bacterium]MBU4078550.1 30S ribosomal protein S6 [Patescibacteria group bacterium]